MYEYYSIVTKVVDGDTLDCSLDLGFGIIRTDRFRLLGLNAEEHYTDAGKKAIAFVTVQLKNAKQIIVRTDKDKREKFGRFLATVIIDGQNLNELLISSGNAVAWDGKGQRPT